MTKRIILWTAPRCLSNVLLCSMSTLKNAKYFHELFSGPHYFTTTGTPGRYDAAEEDIPVDELTYDGVKNMLATADCLGTDIVFSKELAFCLPESMYHEITSGNFVEFIHCFLIRDPGRAIYSYYKCVQHEEEGTPLVLSEIKTFYSKLYKLYNFVKEKKGSVPVVIDAADLQTHPEKVMKSFCEAIGIQFDPKMLLWEPYHFIPRYKVWPSSVWHSTVIKSSGFIKVDPEKQKPVPINDLPQDVQKYIKDSRFYYEELQKACIKPV